MRDAAVQASPRVDILRIEATREAPILDPKNLPDDIRPATDEEVVKAHCAANLTNYKRPRFIEFRAELPKTNVGKILRRELR